jgi:hypothetical protein
LDALCWHLHRPRLSDDCGVQILPKTINSTDHHSHCLPRTCPLRATGACTRAHHRQLHAPAVCPRAVCAPADDVHTHALHTIRPQRQPFRRHVPAGRCGRRVGDEVYGSTGRRSTLRRAPPTRSAVRRSLRKIDRLPDPARHKPAVESLLVLHHLLRARRANGFVAPVPWNSSLSFASSRHGHRLEAAHGFPDSARRSIGSTPVELGHACEMVASLVRLRSTFCRSHQSCERTIAQGGRCPLQLIDAKVGNMRR